MSASSSAATMTARTRTFVEQVPGLTTRHARRTTPQRRFLEAIGLALCGRAGSRLASTLGVTVSRSTMVRLVRAIPDLPTSTVTFLGVDDFALKRGHPYGTVLIDCQTRQIIDMIAGRDAATLATWLIRRPGAQIICRDRSGSYANPRELHQTGEKVAGGVVPYRRGL